MPVRRSARNHPLPVPGRERPRRLRRSASIRDLVAESDVELRRLVYPVFVRPGSGGPRPVPSMPGVEQQTVDSVGALARELLQLGIRAILLFGIARRKYADGREAWANDGVVPSAVREIRRKASSLVIATDVCLCAYTTHGHCGVVQNGEVANDPSCEALARVAVAHARAGADILAPSAMMDGQVAAVRAALDREGYEGRAILAYSSKHASSFYGPFRDVEQSTPSFGDRKGYQMDPRNAREALREMALDVSEGADILMVKPALTSLDLLARAREAFVLPLAAFQVSGEYSMLKAAAERSVIEERPAVEETLRAIRRAGADLIVTYYARDVARWARHGP